MNRVLEIDEELGYARRRAGRALVRPLRGDQGGRAQADGCRCADLGWGSVIGNSLDNGVTYLPYGSDMAACRAAWRSCSPAASCMRTGMGAMPGNQSWHVYKRGLGPTLDQLFMQSNFGIVTKMGVWLMP